MYQTGLVVSFMSEWINISVCGLFLWCVILLTLRKRNLSNFFSMSKSSKKITNFLPGGAWKLKSQSWSSLYLKGYPSVAMYCLVSLTFKLMSQSEASSK